MRKEVCGNYFRKSLEDKHEFCANCGWNRLAHEFKGGAMSEERLFVIMEVEYDYTYSEGPPGSERAYYLPKGVRVSAGEYLRLHPSRIIKASRLRYGQPDQGERIFTKLGWQNIEFNQIMRELNDGYGLTTYLILDPEPGEDDSWLIG